jgi:hypothetical protein
MTRSIDECIEHVIAKAETPASDVIAKRVLMMGPEITPEFIENAIVERVNYRFRKLSAGRDFTKSDDAPARKVNTRWTNLRHRAPFLAKYEDELTIFDIDYIIEQYEGQRDASQAKMEYWSNRRSLLASSDLSTLGELWSDLSVAA